MVVAITACEFSTPPRRSEMLKAMTCRKGTASIIIDPLRLELPHQQLHSKEEWRSECEGYALAALEDATTAEYDLRNKATREELIKAYDSA
jgi:hypothetical protein